VFSLASQNYTPFGPFYSAISHCARPRSVVFIHGSCPRHAYTQTPRGIAQVLPGGHLLDAVQCRSADHTGQSVSQNVHHHVAVHTQDRAKQCGMELTTVCGWVLARSADRALRSHPCGVHAGASIAGRTCSGNTRLWDRRAGRCADAAILREPTAVFHRVAACLRITVVTLPRVGVGLAHQSHSGEGGDAPRRHGRVELG
jgi:hypothetical protein